MVQSVSMSSLLKPSTPTPTEKSENDARSTDNLERDGSVTPTEAKKESGVVDAENGKLAVEAGEKSGEEVSEFDVWWENDKDPQNPQNWSSRKKWANIAVMSSITFLT